MTDDQVEVMPLSQAAMFSIQDMVRGWLHHKTRISVAYMPQVDKIYVTNYNRAPF